MRILVACALRPETRLLRQATDWPVGWLTTGLGARKTRRTLNRHLAANPIDLVLFTGTAGQLRSDIALGTTVFPAVWLDHRTGHEFPCHPETCRHLGSSGFTFAGTGLTVSRPVTTRKTRLRLHQDTGADICDMEATAALAAAAATGIPAIAFKTVSDTGDTPLTAYFSSFRTSMQRLAADLERLLDGLPT